MNKKKILAYLGLVLMLIIIPFMTGSISVDPGFVNSKILEWSNDHFWRGFLIGGVVEGIFAFIGWSIYYLIEKDE